LKVKKDESQQEMSKGCQFDLCKSTRAHVAGYVIKQTMKYLKNCKKCKLHVIGNEKSTKDVELLVARTYTKSNRFTIPSNVLVSVRMKEILPKICLKRGLTSILTDELQAFVEPLDIPCLKHDCKVSDVFLKVFMNFYLNIWCKNVNNILNGTVLQDVNDDVKKLALRRYHMYRKKKSALYKTKQLD